MEHTPLTAEERIDNAELVGLLATVQGLASGQAAWVQKTANATLVVGPQRELGEALRTSAGLFDEAAAILRRAAVIADRGADEVARRRVERARVSELRRSVPTLT